MSLLTVSSLTKRFGGLIALRDVSFDLEQNETLGIIGPNGAGKSTIFNIISGFLPVDNGRILFEERNLIKMKPHKIAKIGIGKTYQNIQLFSSLSVMDNIFIGSFHRFKSSDWGEVLYMKRAFSERLRMMDSCIEIAKYLGIESYLDTIVSNLPYGIQKKVEIARAMSGNPKLILLDEPAAGLNSYESEELMELIKGMIKKGITVLLIDHDMNVIMRICDRIIVLDHGEKIAEGTPKEIQSNPKVIEAYLGKEGDQIA